MQLPDGSVAPSSVKQWMTLELDLIEKRLQPGKDTRLLWMKIGGREYFARKDAVAEINHD